MIKHDIIFFKIKQRSITPTLIVPFESIDTNFNENQCKDFVFNIWGN